MSPRRGYFANVGVPASAGPSVLGMDDLDEQGRDGDARLSCGWHFCVSYRQNGRLMPGLQRAVSKQRGRRYIHSLSATRLQSVVAELA